MREYIGRYVNKLFVCHVMSCRELNKHHFLDIISIPCLFLHSLHHKLHHFYNSSIRLLKQHFSSHHRQIDTNPSHHYALYHRHTQSTPNNTINRAMQRALPTGLKTAFQPLES